MLQQIVDHIIYTQQCREEEKINQYKQRAKKMHDKKTSQMNSFENFTRKETRYLLDL